MRNDQSIGTFRHALLDSHIVQAEHIVGEAHLSAATTTCQRANVPLADVRALPLLSGSSRPYMQYRFPPALSISTNMSPHAGTALGTGQCGIAAAVATLLEEHEQE